MTVHDLPAVNAALNATAAVLLSIGWWLIRHGHVQRHRKVMIAAFSVSVAFLLSYLVYHAQVGSVRFTKQGPIRIVYFTILLTHTVLAAVIVPMVLLSLSRGLKMQYDRHRAIARWTMPLWLYVSVTGVIVYLMLYRLSGAAAVAGRHGPPRIGSVSASPSLAAESAVLNPHIVAGSAAILVALLSLLVYLYRRRLFVLWWAGAWALLSLSMFSIAQDYGNEKIAAMAYGTSQFLGVLSSLAFVVAADAYRQRPRLRRGYGRVLLAVAIYFILLPVALGPRIVFAVGHLLIAGGMAAAAVAHLLLLRYSRLLGTTVVGVALLAMAGLNIWMGATIGTAESTATMTFLLFGMSVVFLVGGLGQQLMAFEDMTFELQQTNQRLETAKNELRQLVITDPLTGTRNRRFFDEIIPRELQRHRRYRSPLSLVFIDVDRFKTINDTLGHEAGDRVLRDVALFLVRNIREADYVFRWGGDEFLVLISCSEQDALRRGVELQAAFAVSPQVARLPAGVGLSIGCVEVPPDTEDIMPLIQAADERMYADKKHHRGSRQRAH